MAYEDRSRGPEMPHNVIIESRERLSVSGVEDVESFDEGTIVIYTTKGPLVLKGSDMHIGRLSLDNGELSVEGSIDSLTYEDQEKPSGGFLSRLFG